MKIARSVISLSKELIDETPEKLLKHIRNTDINAKYVEKLISEPDENNFTPTEVSQLRSIIFEYGRPVYLVQNNSFNIEEVNSSEWRDRLQRYKENIERVLPSVGRIEITGHADFEWGGTGFLVAPRILLTNRHVAQIFCESEHEFREGMTARIDFREEYNVETAKEIKIIRPLIIGEKYDFAFFEVEKDPTLPKPLLIAHEAVRRAPEERLAFTVGYPAFDPRSDVDVQMRIFNGIFNVKRFAPGKIRSIFTYEEQYQFIDHDCTTLGGNSGSCLIDMETGTVMGLHFGGLYLKYNLAVPIWEIEDAINEAKDQIG